LLPDGRLKRSLRRSPKFEPALPTLFVTLLVIVENAEEFAWQVQPLARAMPRAPAKHSHIQSKPPARASEPQAPIEDGHSDTGDFTQHETKVLPIAKTSIKRWLVRHVHSSALSTKKGANLCGPLLRPWRRGAMYPIQIYRKCSETDHRPVANQHSGPSWNE
jgi:hypothetical protein